tara:strand:- start:516 stop:905 length:390 start_codon:yes stop_codon:yes gene_type:complete
MGDRVSISFKDNDDDESVALFHHWGGTEFPKVAFDWFREFKKSLKSMTRLESRNIMAQFVQWLGQRGHYRECIGFEEGKFDKPLYSDELLSHNIYFGKDQNDGDNSDNGHYVIHTIKGEMLDDKGQSIK